ncbi:MAG: protease complex subunit PrcB family protein [Lachnospiraceae bacterium]|nr:protease complex subunit PrcB family protein [Lachnospiraceae bacterium]
MRERWIQVFTVLAGVWILAGCSLVQTESVKLKDLEYVALSESVVPQEIMELIREKQGEPFRFTFRDRENLYICIGYGAKDKGGYRIAVDELYLTETSVCVQTTLLGPKDGEMTEEGGNPVIVIRTENTDKQVIYK